MTSETSDTRLLRRPRPPSRAGLRGALDRLAFFGTLAAAPVGPLLAPLAARREARIEAAHPPRGRLIYVGGIAVHAIEGGPPGAPDAVLIHGASGNARDIATLGAHLGPRVRWVAFDRPGLGYTGRTNPNHDRAFSTSSETLAEQARLLSAAARRLGAERPVVLGHSFGGAVALAWACAHPTAGLVLLGGVSQVWPGGLGPLYAILGSRMGGAFLAPAAAALTPRSKVAATIRSIFRPNQPPSRYADTVGATLVLRRRSLAANARQMQRLKRDVAAMMPLYPSLRIPVEIVHGTADAIVPPEVHALPLAEQVPSAAVALLPGIGHMPHHAAPEAVAAALDRVLARGESADAGVLCHADDPGGAT
jgi:pimeloyl-ACP methyl ester carboxylesterase